MIGIVAQKDRAAACAIDVRDDMSRNSSKSSKKSSTKADRRAQRECELASKQTALPSQRYDVIVADPECGVHRAPPVRYRR
jgi:hypothetical protein